MSKSSKKSGDHLYRRKGSKIFWGVFYDRNGKRHRRSTGDTDRKAAGKVLARWEQEASNPCTEYDQTLNDCLQTFLEDKERSTKKENLAFLLCKAKALVTVLGWDTPISKLLEPGVGWRYIDERRKMPAHKGNVCDRTIRRELKVLRQALAMARSRGFFHGDPNCVLPPDFVPARAAKGDVLSREDAPKIFPYLSPNAAAAVAFSLATGAEKSALRNALYSDIPEDLSTCRTVQIRGTKNKGRNSPVPIVTDEQRVLLEYARKYATRTDEKLFGNIGRLDKELKYACNKVGITVISPHDLRRSAGQWMVDLGVSIELVSKFMRHASTQITESVYASVKQEDVRDRMLHALNPDYRKLNTGAGPQLVATLSEIPAPRGVPGSYEVDGVTRSLTEWSALSGIAKTTLHGRVTARGMTMKDALALGKANYRSRKQNPATAAAQEGEDACVTGVSDSVDTLVPNGQKELLVEEQCDQDPREIADSSARHTRFERMTFGFGGRHSIQLS